MKRTEYQIKKELMFTDVCARLYLSYKEETDYYERVTLDGTDELKVNNAVIVDWGAWDYLRACEVVHEKEPLTLRVLTCARWVKPYLRQMSDMTEKEKREFSMFIHKTETYKQQVCLDSDSMASSVIGGFPCVYLSLFDKFVDWLIKHHIDFRGLIAKGLAIKAPEGMYKFE